MSGQAVADGRDRNENGTPECRNNEQTEDRQLISCVQQNGCDNCFDLFYTRYRKLTLWEVSKIFHGDFCSDYRYQDFLDELPSIVFRSMQTFDLTRDDVQPSTWLVNMIKYSCFYSINSVIRRKKEIDGMYMKWAEAMGITEQKNPFDAHYEEKLFYSMVAMVSTIKDPRVRRVIELRYLNGGNKVMTWEEIGRQIGASRAWAVKLHDRGIGYLRKNSSKIERMTLE